MATSDARELTKYSCVTNDPKRGFMIQHYVFAGVAKVELEDKRSQAKRMLRLDKREMSA